MSLDPADVTAVLVTRGDVDLAPILETLPYGETIVFDNSERPFDWKLFGRYMGLLEARNRVCFVQDDDCLVRNHDELLAAYEPGLVVGNFRRDEGRERFYHDTTLLGWGAIFDRDLPWKAFMNYARLYPFDWDFMVGLGAEFTWPVLTGTRKILVEPEWLQQDGQPIFARANRMSQAPGFYEEIDRVLARAREVRDRLAAGE